MLIAEQVHICCQMDKVHVDLQACICIILCVCVHIWNSKLLQIQMLMMEAACHLEGQVVAADKHALWRPQGADYSNTYPLGMPKPFRALSPSLPSLSFAGGALSPFETLSMVSGKRAHVVCVHLSACRWLAHLCLCMIQGRL